MARGEIELSKLTKEFAEVRAVDAIDLHVPGGQPYAHYVFKSAHSGRSTTTRRGSRAIARSRRSRSATTVPPRPSPS